MDLYLFVDARSIEKNDVFVFHARELLELRGKNTGVFDSKSRGPPLRPLSHLSPFDVLYLVTKCFLLVFALHRFDGDD